MDEYEYNICYQELRTGRDIVDNSWTDREEAQQWVDNYVAGASALGLHHFEARLVKRRRAGVMVDA